MSGEELAAWSCACSPRWSGANLECGHLFPLSIFFYSQRAPCLGWPASLRTTLFSRQ